MRLRALTPVLLFVLIGVVLGVTLGAAGSVAGPADRAIAARSVAPASAPTTPDTTPPDTRPPITANEFVPQDRSLGDCISSVPKPGCGSEAQGGWRQTLVFAAIVAGLAIIVWRVIAGSHRARADAARSAGP